jgi:hypothetical protein
VLSAVPILPRPRPTREGIAAGSALPPAAVALAFTLAQLLFVAPGLHLAWDESVYVSQVVPHVPSAYFSAPRARGVPVLIAPLTLPPRLATALLPPCAHHKVPAYARRWTSHPLRGLLVHRVYLSPW